MWCVILLIIILLFILAAINSSNERYQYDEEVKKMAKANGELVKWRHNINKK